jgi:hypothetical protein
MKAVTAVLILALCKYSFAGEPPVTVEPGGDAQVDELVSHLVSTKPAPFPSGSIRMTVNSYETPEVAQAMDSLIKLGHKAFPALVTHLRDDRYSYSYILSAWINFSVGDAVVAILSDGLDLPYDYKSRPTPSGEKPGLYFKDYLLERGPEKWADWAKDRKRAEIQTDFFHWGLAKEKQRGFVNDEQRKEIVNAYQAAMSNKKNGTGGVQ